MKNDTPLLDLPVESVARLLALTHLQAADEARRRLGSPGDADALHDFRVALRRLRSTLRVYRPHLPEPKGKERRRLKRVADATGPSRDLEVQIEWLRDRAGEWNAVEAVGREWLLRRVEAEAAEEDARFRETVERRFPGARKRLRRRLASYEVRVDPDSFRPPEMARAAVGAALESVASRFQARLDLVRAVTDQAEAHRARIEAKRLRYLLEPYRSEDSALREVVKELKGLQQLLGELHDVEGMRARVSAEVDALPGEEEAVRAGLMLLLERLRARQQELFDQLHAEWLHDGAAPFFGRVRALAERLSGREDVEIERKYLLRALPALPDGAEGVWIEQGWLPGERLLERVRRVSSPEGERCYRTVKLGSGIRRVEVEEATSTEVFRALWPLTEGRRVRKQRFRVPEDGVVWEVDSFPDLGMVLAEVELDSADASVALPAWLEPHVEREVTDEPRYLNVNLAG